MAQTDDIVQPADIDEFLGVQPPRARARLLQWGAIGLGVLLILFLLSRCVFGNSAAVAYATRPVERGDLTVTVSATGNLAPTNQVEVGSEISGLVTDIYVDDNDRVAKGQILARIDTSRLQDTINQSRAQLQAAQASVNQAQAGVKLAQASLARQLQVYKLSGGKVPSATELDTARAQAAQATAALQAAQASVAQQAAALSSNRTQFEKASIRSPVNGVVLLRQIDRGQTVAASLNAPTLFVIAEDLSQMKLEAKVDEADVGQVQPGQDASFTVDAFPGRTFPAKIIRVNVGSTATGTTATSTSTNTVVAYTAVLSVANPDLTLRPGMTATADIVTTEKSNVLLVPNAALRFSPERAAREAKAGAGTGITGALMPARPRRGGGGGRGFGGGGGGRDVAIGRGSRQTVYVLGAEGTPQAVHVVVGDSDGSNTEITGSDLKAGQRVITGQLAAGQNDDQGTAGSTHRRGSHRWGQQGAAGGAAGNSSAAAPPPATPAPPASSAPAAPVAPSHPAVSQPATAISSNNQDGAARQARFANMTPEQRAAMRTRFEGLTPEQRAAWRAEHGGGWHHHDDGGAAPPAPTDGQ